MEECILFSSDLKVVCICQLVLFGTGESSATRFKLSFENEEHKSDSYLRCINVTQKE